MSEVDRAYCLRWYGKAIQCGCFNAARHMLRAALKFRSGGRVKSLARDYFFRRGKLAWYHWGN